MRRYLILLLASMLVVASGCGSTESTTSHDETKVEESAKAKTTQEKQEDLTPRPSEESTPSYDVVYLGKDQTLYSLAQKHNTSVEGILAANDHISDPRNIPAGKPVLIPVKDTATSQKEETASQPGHQASGENSTSSGSEAEPENEKNAEAAAEPKDVSHSELHRGQSDARFWWPTAGEVIRGFKDSLRGYEDPGIGIAAPGGQEVCAVADGTVRASVDSGRKGNRGWERVVVIRHDNNFVSWYGLLSERTVEKGQEVQQGQRIGRVSPRGIDGRTQLEFRLYRDEQEVDPVQHLP